LNISRFDSATIDERRGPTMWVLCSTSHRYNDETRPMKTCVAFKAFAAVG